MLGSLTIINADEQIEESIKQLEKMIFRKSEVALLPKDIVVLLNKITSYSKMK